MKDVKKDLRNEKIVEETPLNPDGTPNMDAITARAALEWRRRQTRR